jgi:hypothetical protein
VLWGSYALQGDSLRVTARIVDAATGGVLRTLEPVVVPRREPSVAAELVANRALAAVAVLEDVRQSAWLAEARHAPDYGAYRAFDEGMQRAVLFDHHAAIARFREASALDSTFVQPLLWAADPFTALGDFRAVDSVLRLADRKRSHLSQFDRLLLDHQRADLRNDRGAALVTAREMVAISPGPESQLLLGQEAMRSNRPREAAATFARIDPERGVLKGWSGYWGWPMWANLWAGDVPAALTAAREGRRRWPSSRQAVLHEIIVYGILGDTAAVARRLAEADALPPDPGLPTSRLYRAAANLLVGSGFPDRARPFIARGIPMIDPNDTTSEGDYNRQTLVEFLYLDGQYRRASPIVARMARAHPDDLTWTGFRGLIAAQLDDSVTALAIERQLAGDPQPGGFSSRAFWRARIHSALGHRTESLSLIRAGYASAGGDVDLSAARLYSDFVQWHADPEYQAIVRPKG